jgi:BTB/POZ domain
MNQSLFSNELEFLYTGKGLGDAFEFLFDSAESREENDAEDSRLDKLRKDLVFMWRSRLYSDVRIALTGNFSSTNHESATAIFSSHRFMLVTRSPYFYTSLLQWGKSPASKGANGDEPFTITLPSPPFTPASLHFALGYIYTGTLVFSHRTYDLDTAFHIMRSATYISIQSLYDEVQARIVQEMMHGLYHAFLEFSEYERITGGKWGSGGCRCRQCARRAPRVLEFAISEDVKNPHLERGARRALVGLYGDGWCTSEFAKLPEKTRMQLVKGLAKRTTPINIFPLLFATHHALKKLNNILDSWADSVREMVSTARKTIDEVLCKQCDQCFEQPEWIDFMVHDGTRFEDAERVEWIMDTVKRGLDEKNAGLVYQVGDKLSVPVLRLNSS